MRQPPFITLSAFMQIEYNKSLKSFNTFGIDVIASSYIKVTTVLELKEVLLTNKNQALFILNGGSNMLLTKDIHALVVHIAIKGIIEKKKDENSVIISAGAGENWHDFVLYCISKNYGGVENLSLIPGNVGSAPIQNIGAYGVELKDVFDSCTAIEIATGEERIFDNDECNFGYRESVFKNNLKGKYVITEVSFQLTTQVHKININYGAIKNELENKDEDPGIKQISDAVITIRQQKLPDPSKIGNGGSFFKNPVVARKVLKSIQKNYENVPFYKVDEQFAKIPAGWLIEKAGFKGKRWKDAGVHKNEALVLINYGTATGSEILEVARNIQKKVQQQFQISLETEVNIF